MNVLSIFEQRISAIFEEGAPGQRKPFSFKRLAKRAVREMEDETFVIDGIDTAPALYTVLVSAKDDELMRPMYAPICDEVSQLVEAQAKKRGYAFVGRPLVRFMVDPALRGGRFSVFAENIDPRTLARLRDEENAYLGITSPHNMPADQGFVPEYVPVVEHEPESIASQVDFVDVPTIEDDDPDDSLDVPKIPTDESVDTSLDAQEALEEPVFDELDEPVFEDSVPLELEDEPEEPCEEGFEEETESEAPATSEPVNTPEEELEAEEEPALIEEPAPEIPEESDALADAVAASIAPEFEEIPTTRARHIAPSPTPAPLVEVPQDPKPVQPSIRSIRPQRDTCTLTDTATGRTYQIIVRRTPIGRERVGGGIVLRDPNASRRHAELVFEGGVWVIRDLGSTNGTLVDDMDVQEAMLTDGDVITIGLTNLEFRAG